MQATSNLSTGLFQKRAHFLNRKGALSLFFDKFRTYTLLHFDCGIKAVSNDHTGRKSRDL